MPTPVVLGIAGGAVSATISIASNLWRADPDLVSAAPDVLSALLMAGLVSLVVGKGIGAAGPVAATTAARRATRVAAGTCALPMGVFTWLYLPSHAFALAAAAAGMSFIYVSLVGLAATYITLWSSTRVWPHAHGRS